MARQPTPEIQLTERLQPQAAVTDTYVRPAEPPKSSLWQVADALGKFDAGLQSWMQENKAKTKENDLILGQAAFIRSNQKPFAEAVRTGKIGANQSPDFMSGYKMAEGSALGNKIQTDLAVAYETWGGKDSQDPAAFDKWYGDYVSGYLADQNDPEVLKGLLPQLRQTAEAMHGQYQQQVSKNVYESGVRAHVADATRNLDNAYVRGIESNHGVAYDQIWTDILSSRENALKTGIRADDFEKEMVARIEAAAIEHHDPEILKLLDRKLPGRDYTIRTDPVYRDSVSKTEADLMNIAEKVNKEQLQAAKDADEARLKGLRAGVMEGLAKDPRMDIPEEVLKEGTKLDPEFRTKVIEARKKLIEGSTTPDDPGQVNKLYRDIAQGGGQKAVLDAIHDGALTDASAIKDAMAFAKTHEDAKKRGSTISREPAYERVVKAITMRTAPDGITDPFAVGGTSDEGFQALNDFDRMVLDWDAKNPDATALEKSEFINKAGKQVLDGIQQPELSTSTGTPYKSPAGAPGDNPFNNDAAAPQDTQGAAQPGLPAGGGAAVPSGSPQDTQQGNAPGASGGGDGGGVPQRAAPETPGSPSGVDINSLTPERRRALEERAKTLGIDPKVLLERALKRLPAPQQQGALPAGTQLAEAPVTLGAGKGDFEEPLTSPKVSEEIKAKFAGSRRRVPVSIRNNNPAAISISGNIKASFAAKQPGFIGVTKRPANEGGYYAKFATPEDGLRAASVLLQQYGRKGVNTPDAIVKKWSTDSSAWATYSKTLQAYLGIGSGKQAVDLNDPQVRAKILMAKSAHESGAGVPVYKQEVYMASLQ